MRSALEQHGNEKCSPWLPNGILVALLALAACDNQPPEESPPPTIEVTTVIVTPRDTPVEMEFVAETQSFRQVEIRARVEGFLEKRLYTEGELVKAGQKMYQMDQKPFLAALQSAKGQLAQQEAALAVAEATLARVRPLTEKNALSKKKPERYRRDGPASAGNPEGVRAAL